MKHPERDQIVGKIKKSYGWLTDDHELEKKGRRQEVKAKQESASKARRAKQKTQ